MCNALKLCKLCMREDVAGHEKLCMVLKVKQKNKGKTKYEFTCKEVYCSRHMWLCAKHKSVNQESMETKANQLDKDHGLKLVHLLGFNNLTQPAANLPPMQTSDVPQPIQTSRPATDSKAFRHAEKKLRQRARKSSDSPVEVVPVPEGNPMFMFQALKGITEPVFGFFDSGWHTWQPAERTDISQGTLYCGGSQRCPHPS